MLKRAPNGQAREDWSRAPQRARHAKKTQLTLAPSELDLLQQLANEYGVAASRVVGAALVLMDRYGYEVSPNAVVDEIVRSLARVGRLPRARADS